VSWGPTPTTSHLALSRSAQARCSDLLSAACVAGL